MKKRLVFRLLFAALLLALYCFIFGNSATAAKASIAKSDQVIVFVEAVVRPVLEIVTRKPVTYEVLNVFVRKSAHFLEFGLLGALWMGFSLTFPALRTWLGFFVPLFASLASAVCDEFVQSFLDRTSSVRDVVLDFSGALAGMAAAFCVFLLILAHLRRAEKKRKAA